MCDPQLSSTGDFMLGPWIVQPRLRRITRGNQVERLEPRCMDLLVFFARHPNQVHSRERLIEEVWRVRAIAVNTLTHAIAELRRALDDNARKPRFIETIHRCGYRLLVRPGPAKDEHQIMHTSESTSDSMIRGVDRTADGGLLIAMEPPNENTLQSLQGRNQPTEVVVRICIEMPEGLQTTPSDEDAPISPRQQKIC